MEIWKDVIGYEGRYQVSNYGRVKSLELRRPTKCNVTRLTKEKILSKRLDSKGYPCVMLYDGSIPAKPKSFKVHRLVASSFFPGDHTGLQVNHKDLNKANNHIENLEWVTPSENMQHAVHNGAMKPTYGKRPEHWRKMIEEGAIKHFGKPVLQMDLEGKVISEFRSASEAGRALFGKSKTHITSCCNGHRKTCGGYKWAYK